MARRAMRVAIETDTRGFVTGMNKANQSVEQMRNTVGGSATAIRNLGNSLDSLSGNTLGLGFVTGQLSSVSTLSKGIHQSWVQLKNVSFSAVSSGIGNMTAQTRLLTLATIALKGAALLGIGLVIAGTVNYISKLKQQNEELKNQKDLQLQIYQTQHDSHLSNIANYTQQASGIARVTQTERERLSVLKEQIAAEEQLNQQLKSDTMTIERRTAFGVASPLVVPRDQIGFQESSVALQRWRIEAARAEERILALEQEQRNQENRDLIKRERFILDMHQKRRSSAEQEFQQYAKYTQTQEEQITAEIQRRLKAYQAVVVEARRAGLSVPANFDVVKEGIRRDVLKMFGVDGATNAQENQVAQVAAIMQGSMADYQARIAATDPRTALIEEQNKMIRNQNLILADTNSKVTTLVNEVMVN
jgi:hypothetical protein